MPITLLFPKEVMMKRRTINSALVGAWLVGLSACVPATATNPNQVATLDGAGSGVTQSATPEESVVETPVTVLIESVTLTPGPTPVPGELLYYWPVYLPEGFTVFLRRTYGDADGYTLTLTGSTSEDSPLYGAVLRLQGGATRQGEGEDTPRFYTSLQTICATSGCTPYDFGFASGLTSTGTGGGIAHIWEVDGQVYSIGCQCDPPKVELDRIARSLVPVDLETWLANVAELPVEE